MSIPNLITILLILSVGMLVAVTLITYLYNIYKLYTYSRSQRTTFVSEFKVMDKEPQPISDEYMWFASNERTLWKIPFDEIKNNQSVKFKVTFNNVKFASVGTLNHDFGNASQSFTLRGTSTRKFSVFRNYSIGTISSPEGVEKIITDQENPIIYIENIGPNPPIIEDIERRTYNAVSLLPDPVESLIIPQRMSFDREDLDVDTIHQTVLVAANSDGYKLQEGFRAKPIFSEDIVDWLRNKETELPYPPEERNLIELRNSPCIGDFASRFVTKNLEGNLVVYHIDHTLTNKAEYVRLSLIDEYGEEIFKTDSIDWGNESSSSVYIGEKIWKTRLSVPLGVKAQLMESIYGPPLPYVESVFPMAVFNYEEISKRIFN